MPARWADDRTRGLEALSSAVDAAYPCSRAWDRVKSDPDIAVGTGLAERLALPVRRSAQIRGQGTVSHPLQLLDELGRFARR